VHLGVSLTFFFLFFLFVVVAVEGLGPIRFMSNTHDLLQRSLRDTNAKAQSESRHTEKGGHVASPPPSRGM
jgi:hypothetical protein